MADDDNVLFVWRNSDRNQEDSDAWDDTALIKAYDRAVNLAKEEVAKRMGENVQGSQTKQKTKNFKRSGETGQARKWTVGAPCRARYDDGNLYEARVTEIDQIEGTCVVKFLGYGNTATVNLNSLWESEGLQSQIAQQNVAAADQYNEDNNEMEYERNQSTVKNCKRPSSSAGKRMDYESENTKGFKNTFMPGLSFNSSLNMMPPAPPLPPQLMAKLPENDADALSSMLMSWYISGFHTGYYHGLKQAQSNQEKRKNC